MGIVAHRVLCSRYTFQSGQFSRIQRFWRFNFSVTYVFFNTPEYFDSPAFNLIPLESMTYGDLFTSKTGSVDNLL